MPKELATFKYAPSKTIPTRQGPVQCIRNCTNCILNQNYDEDAEVENVIAIRSYDDLVQRQSIWISQYQTVQYHLGQVDVLKQTLKTIGPTLTIYVVATNRLKDIEILKKVLSREKLPSARLQVGSTLDPVRLRSDSTPSHIIVPIKLISCVTSVELEDGLLEVKDLRDLLASIVGELQAPGSELKIAIVPVAISKDHDKSTLFGVGSICVQIMQPYPIQEYLQNARTHNKTNHLVQHLYHDLSLYSPRLPSQMVALLLVYLERPCGVSREDLVDYMEWFKKSSMEFDLHLAFTGETDQAIDFALLILEDYVQYDPDELVYRAKNIDALTYYASAMIPNLAYYGLISRAMLILYNRDDSNAPLVRFSPGVPVKVMRDDLLELGQDIAARLDNLLPCRRPCVDIRTSLVASFNSMMTFGKYFRIQEAHARQSKGLGWLGDYDSDEEYFLSKRDDPAFKAWVILTQRPYRLDRLNLFVNVVEAYLEWIASGEDKFGQEPDKN